MQLVSIGCQGSETALSPPPWIVTSQWGDLAGMYSDCRTMPNGYVDCWTAPDGDADFDDITAVVDKFRNLPGAPHKSRADIAPASPHGVVDFSDIPAVVEAFRGLPYPYPGPSPCE